MCVQYVCNDGIPCCDIRRNCLFSVRIYIQKVVAWAISSVNRQGSLARTRRGRLSVCSQPLHLYTYIYICFLPPHLLRLGRSAYQGLTYRTFVDCPKLLFSESWLIIEWGGSFSHSGWCSVGEWKFIGVSFRVTMNVRVFIYECANAWTRIFHLRRI